MVGCGQSLVVDFADINLCSLGVRVAECFRDDAEIDIFLVGEACPRVAHDIGSEICLDSGQFRQFLEFFVIDSQVVSVLLIGFLAVVGTDNRENIVA